MRFSTRALGALKAFVFCLALVPLGALAAGLVFRPEWLGANPAEFITRSTGDWTLRFLLITLAVTPLRKLFGWHSLARFRRMLGLYAFFYGVVHLSSYVSFDHAFDVTAILEDIVKRPFITVGFTALVLMAPLAITSTDAMVRRLGAQRWLALHRLVYAIAPLGVLHFWWLAKKDVTEPAIYAAILAALLGYRIASRIPALHGGTAMKRTALLVLAAVVIPPAAAAGGYWFAVMRLSAAAAAAGAVAPAAEAADTSRKPLYYYDPMFPQQKFDKPGKSPFMDMQLVPKYGDDAGADEGRVSISPRLAQNLGVRTAHAQRGSLAPKLAAVGSVEYNERTMAVVQPRVAGFVEKLHVRAALDPVRAGEPLVEMLFPEWAAAQEEFLLLQRLSISDAEALRRAARQRLVLLGMSEEQIAALEREGQVQLRVTLRAPLSGVIAELGVREGMTVGAGTTLFRIAGLGTVWVVAEVPEAQAGMLVPGARVEVRVPAYPEQAFAGRLGAVLPQLNAGARTVRARVEIANPAGRLKPGMYATLAFSGRGREALIVPSEAVIRTGERSVVIVVQADGRFRAAEVDVGAEAGGSAEIRKGLEAGDKVVVSGQFLIDSEASLRSTLARLEGSSE